MLHHRSAFALALALTTALAGVASAAAQLAPASAAVPLPPADTVLEGGRIRTPDGWQTSVAILRGAIVAIGDDAAMKPYIGPRTRRVKLNGRVVLPGLRDLHVHPLFAGQSEVQCKIDPSSSLQAVVAAVAGCVKAKKPGEWVVGRAYEPAALRGTPTRSVLDAVSPNNPVVLNDVSIHSSWANSAALRAAGITRTTPNPAGGIIERDAAGEPTGILREAAAALVRTKVTPFTRAQNASALRWALDTVVRYGIVGIEDALVTQDAAQAYADLSDAGLLKLPVRGCIIDSEQTLIARRQYYARPRFTPDCVKILTDGVPTDAHTASMLEDYAGHAHGSDASARGMLMVPGAKLAADLVRYDAMGLTVKLHAAGDGAVRASLDAIAAARAKNGPAGPLHNVAHASFVDPADLKRAHAINATIEFSPYIWAPSPIVDNVVQAVGPERMRRWIPVREAIDAGVLAVPGSDWNVVPSVDPWSAMETLVTRRAPGGGGAPVGAAEAITLPEAFAMFTVNAARQSREADRSGTIEPGKRADLIVVDQDIFAVPATSIHNTRVLMTMIAGDTVFRAPGF